MSNPNPVPSTMTNTSKATTHQKRSWGLFFLFPVLVPVIAAILVYQLDSFDPAVMPLHELTQTPVIPLMSNDHMLQGAEYVGVGNLQGPEDLAYDSKLGVIYTGCEDGWIKRVKVSDSLNDSVVENWINTGGRPLGLALGHHNEVIVADAVKGLLNASGDGVVELLTDEAGGQKFKITDGVDVADDGMIYFTDASYKYSLKDYIWDILEGKAHGRFLSFDPATKETKVLLRDLYFANGVVVSPHQHHAIFCETSMRRCKKYYIHGKKKGQVEIFIDNLPGLPDNILYDGQGYYWIALATEVTPSWELAFKYPFIRKIVAIMEKYTGRPHTERNGGVLLVDLEGKPIAHYYDFQLSLVSSGNKIGDHLYCGSIYYPYIIRLNITQHPAITQP
ncbi:Str_synth domain-containing protein [Cephalotus follicularis]|uniref:Str_synth domain-containing protein n=1 Tax=Cephalotus follicularis TaxID=3775 RepID=A0A1Q3CEC8_CEPFO|nr:Str_synth domain-containing protein [Cephalotus follicularis]